MGVFQDWGDERLMGSAGSEPPLRQRTGAYSLSS